MLKDIYKLIACFVTFVCGQDAAPMYPTANLLYFEGLPSTATRVNMERSLLQLTCWQDAPGCSQKQN